MCRKFVQLKKKYNSSGGSRIFKMGPREGEGNPEKGGADLIFWPNFLKNCLKTKKLWRGGGVHMPFGSLIRYVLHVGRYWWIYGIPCPSLPPSVLAKVSSLSSGLQKNIFFYFRIKDHYTDFTPTLINPPRYWLEHFLHCHIERSVCRVKLLYSVTQSCLT